jgi:hypothetical protein
MAGWRDCRGISFTHFMGFNPSTVNIVTSEIHSVFWMVMVTVEPTTEHHDMDLLE